jgi:hypothetical protein
LVIAAALAMTVSARAEQPEEPFLVLSVGSSTCGTFVRSDRNTKELYLGWAVGFITGLNSRASGRDRYAGQGWERNASLVWLENYCTQNPLAPFIAAAEHLRDALSDRS